MSWTDYLGEGVTGLVGVLGTWAGWFFGRKKQAAEVKGAELENVQEAIKIWRETALQLQQKVEKLETEMEQLRQEVATVHAENIRLKQQMK